MVVGGKLASRQMITDIVVSSPIELNMVGELSADQDLSHLGFKSFDIVRLILAVEEAFNLEFPPDMMTADNFSSVGAIERLVESLMS
jgi:acyl carrier protein